MKIPTGDPQRHSMKGLKLIIALTDLISLCSSLWVGGYFVDTNMSVSSR